MKRRTLLIILMLTLTVILVILILAAVHLTCQGNPDPGSTESTGISQNTAASDNTFGTTNSTADSTVQTDSTQSTQTESTQTTETEATQATQTEATQATEMEPPTQTTEPVTGSLYTREELENLPTTSYGYSFGRTSGGARAPGAVSAQEKYGQYGGNFIAPDNGNIYLTFDCGYEYTATDANGNKYRVTEKILDVLKEKNVKAVFFITLSYAKKQPDLVQRMIDEGHAVGNHSANHPVMPNCTIDEMITEVMTLHDYVEENFGYTMTLFRPPTGAYSVQSLAVVQNLGYKNVHWSFAYADWSTDDQPDVAEALALVTGSHHSGAIYLLHAVSTTNAEILGDAIDFFLAQGYNLELFQ